MTGTNGSSKRIKGKYQLFLMALPFLILVLIFSYGPLLGWSLAFFNYRPGIPLTNESFVGFRWFTSMVSNEVQLAEIARVMRNTFAMSLIGIATSVVPVIFAVFLSEIKVNWYKKSVQILTTLPNFISWVLIYSFAFALFSVDGGFVNKILMNLGLIETGIPFLASDQNVWLSMTLWGMWKGLGWGAIMYLAAISGIDQELYEAAKVDGAGRFRMMWHITVPGIINTYFVLLLLSIANFINNGMEQYFVFQNPMNRDFIEVLDLYVYNVGMQSSNFSLATAISMLKSIISILLLFIANNLSKLVRGESII